MISIERGKGFKRVFFWFFFFYLPIKRCKYVTCISESVRDALLKYKCCRPSKLVLIPNPVSDSYIYSPRFFNKNNPRILHIGTRPNKNLTRVIRSLYNVPCHLIIIGELENLELILLNELKINYTNKTHLSDDGILQEYIDCDLVSFPSIYEGFGLPIIEGQAVGRPVLTSNILPMKQVAGENYYLVNPYSEDDIRNGFLTLINNEELRNKMIENGLMNVQKYRTNVVASKYLDLYLKILYK
jgi:glycosyltransferase involved in cell wall biosynthesis